MFTGHLISAPTVTNAYALPSVIDDNTNQHLYLPADELFPVGATAAIDVDVVDVAGNVIDFEVDMLQQACFDLGLMEDENNTLVTLQPPKLENEGLVSLHFSRPYLRLYLRSSRLYVRLKKNSIAILKFNSEKITLDWQRSFSRGFANSDNLPY